MTIGEKGRVNEELCSKTQQSTSAVLYVESNSSHDTIHADFEVPAYIKKATCQEEV